MSKNIKLEVYAQDLTPQLSGEVEPLPNTIPQRTDTGTIKTVAAKGNDEAVNKEQMDAALESKVNADIVDNNPTGNTIAQRTSSGTLKAASPTANDELTTKKYVDDAVKTSSAGGWVRAVDKVWTEDETATSSNIQVAVPTEYQKKFTDFRLRYYINTPNEGAKFADETCYIYGIDSNSNVVAMAIESRLPTKDKTTLNVGWTSNAFEDIDGMRIFTYAGKAYDKGVPTPNERAPLTQSTITYTDAPTILDSFLENRTHTVTNGTITKTYTGTLVTDLQIEPPTSTNVSAIDFGIIEQPLTKDNITSRLSFTKGNVVYNVSAVAENVYDSTYTTLSGTLSPNGYFVYYVSGDNSGKWQKGRLYYTQNNDTTISMDKALVTTDNSVTYTTNDYYATNKPDIILSQVISATNNKHIGELVDFNKEITACTFKWTGETPISYKQVVTAEGGCIDESLYTKPSIVTEANSLTSFEQNNKVYVYATYGFYSGKFNKIMSRLMINVPTSTSNGVTAKKIYAGSRIVLELRY